MDLNIKLNDKFQWIGENKLGWKIIRSKFIFRNKSSKNHIDEELLSVNQKEGVIRRSELDNRVWNPSEDISGYKLVENGNFIISLRSFEGGLELSRIKGLVSPAYTVLETIQKINNDYFWWMMKSNQFIVELNKHVSGIRQGKNISWDDFSNIYLLKPPYKEQSLISKYLYNKTHQIDSLIEKIKNKIQLLKEQKTVLIHQYITKGLQVNQEMINTGIEWIGEIPKNWELKKLKYFSEIIYGISPPEKTYNDEGIGTLLINGPVEYSIEDFGITRSIKWTTEPTKIVQKGSLLFCLRGSTTGRMNITHDEVSIGRGVCAIISKFDQDFLVFAMMIVRIFIQDQISGSTFPSVTKDDVDNFKIPLPDYEEQKNISSKLKTKIQIFDQSIKLHNHKIKLLKEYKQSLISSLVTGKIRITEDMI